LVYHHQEEQFAGSLELYERNRKGTIESPKNEGERGESELTLRFPEEAPELISMDTSFQQNHSEVNMAIVWFLVGSAMVVGPFLIFHVPMDPWPGVVAAGIGGAIFVVLLFLFVILQTALTLRIKLLAGAVLAIAIIASLISWKAMYDMTHYQRFMLGKIRTVIGEGIMESAAYDAMYPPFRKYYEQRPAAKLPIGKIFYAVNKERIHDKVYRFDGDQFNQSDIENLSDSVVTLTLVDTVARGKDLSFANFNGQKGRLQFRAELREKGVHYEREN
jgi:hypothetical protein